MEKSRPPPQFDLYSVEHWPEDRPPVVTGADLEFVTRQINGEIFGGWYRLLPDNRIEIFAMTQIRREPRREASIVEQARRMLLEAVAFHEKQHPSSNAPTPTPQINLQVTLQDADLKPKQHQD